MNELPIALITVRTSSGRLPEKCFLPIAGRPVLEHVLKRAVGGGFHPIVCTSVDRSDDRVAQLAESLEVESFRGDLENKLNRWNMCMSKFGLDRVHLLDADDPYFDPTECLESYELLTETQQGLVLTSEKSDSGFASVGTSITRNFLEEIVSRTHALKSSNFDVIPWELLLRPEDSFTMMPNKDLGFPSDAEMRLTLDYPEDYWLLGILAMNLGVHALRHDVERFLIEHPTLRELNLFRGKDFLSNKKAFKSEQFS